MGAVEDWLRERTRCPSHHNWSLRSKRKQSVLSTRVGARKRGIRCLLHQANAPVFLWPDAAEHGNEVDNHSKRSVPGQNDEVEPIVLERRAFSVQAECDLLPRERETKFVATLELSGVCEKLEHPTGRRGSLDPLALQGILVGWNKGATRHQNCNFPRRRRGAGRSGREPRSGEEMQDDRGREQPDPEELRRRAAEASADAAGARPTMMGGAGPASAEPRRRITVKRQARPAERREERQNGGGDPDRGSSPTRRQRVVRADVQRALVAMAGKTDNDQCWGCNVVYDGVGFCDECVIELQEQCVQDDVRLASCRACTDRRRGPRR